MSSVRTLGPALRRVLAELHASAIHTRSHRRPDGRLGRAAPRNGLCDRVRRPPPSWFVHGRRRRLCHFGPRRVANADWWTYWCLRRDCRRHCPGIRPLWSRAGRNDGGRAAGDHGSHRTRNRRQVYPAPGDDWLYQRHCPADCLHPDQRFPRTHDASHPKRVPATHGDACPIRCHCPVADCRRRDDVTRYHSRLAPVDESNSGLHHRVASGDGCRRRASTSKSKRSEPGSAVFPRAFLNLRFRNSDSQTFSRCFPPRSRLPC